MIWKIQAGVIVTLILALTFGWMYIEKLQAENAIAKANVTTINRAKEQADKNFKMQLAINVINQELMAEVSQLYEELSNREAEVITQIQYIEVPADAPPEVQCINATVHSDMDIILAELLNNKGSPNSDSEGGTPIPTDAVLRPMQEASVYYGGNL